MQKLMHLRLGHKLIGGFILMAAIVATTGSFGIINLEDFGKRVVTMIRAGAVLEKVVLQMEIHQKACRVNLVEGAMVPSDVREFEQYVASYEKKRELFRSSVDVLLKGDGKLGIAPAEAGTVREKLARAVLASWTEFEKVAEELIAQKKGLLAGLTPGVTDQAAMRALADPKLHNLITKGIPEASENAKADIDDLADYVESQMYAAVKDSHRLRKSTITIFVSVTIVAVLIAIFLGMLITRRIVTSLSRVGVALREGAVGNLSVTVEVSSGDELGLLATDLNAMTAKLSAMMRKVNGSTRELTTIAQGIDRASRKVAEAAQLQATGVTTTSSAVTQINASLKGVTLDVDAIAINAEEGSSSLEELVASIAEVAQNAETLSRSVEEVSSSILEMVASIKEVSDGVQNLKDAAVTTAASVLEMDSSIHHVRENAMETADLSKKVQADACAGKVTVEAGIAGMREIKDASRITFEVIQNLSARANDIGGILSVIEEVAEQTNLLGLNASIIAAQAGERGKGFSVVAEEIKALADRTSRSTKEVTALIKGVQEESHRAVTAMSRAEKLISEGESLSQESGEALNKIVASAQQSTDRMEQIARAVAEQAKGSLLIRDSMEKVSSMVSHIGNATYEQRQGSELIITATETMRKLTGEVRASIKEQNKAGGYIAQATTNMGNMIRQVKRACGEQSSGSDQIVAAMENIETSSTVSLDVTKDMELAAARLTGQIAMLQVELDKFVISSS